MKKPKHFLRLGHVIYLGIAAFAFLLMQSEVDYHVTDTTQQRHMGEVQGSLNFPSDYIPNLKIYLINVVTKDVYKSLTEAGQETYIIKDIPAGTYVAFCYYSENYGAGYTYAVPCGCSVNCKDHRLIEFKVNPDSTTTSIDLFDWYEAIIPENPDHDGPNPNIGTFGKIELK